MALVTTHLITEATSQNLNAYTTASIAPAAERLIVIAVGGSRTTAQTPEVSGLGLTWTQQNGGTALLGTINYSTYLFTAWTGATAPTPGSLTITWPGTTMTGCQWSVSEWAGVDNAAGPIVQSLYGKDEAGLLTPLLTLAAFASSTNGTWGCVQTNNTGETITAGSGFTLFGQASNAGPNAKIASEGRVDADTTVDFGGVATTTPWGMVAAEIREATAAGVSGAAVVAGGGGPTSTGQKTVTVAVIAAGGGTPIVGTLKATSVAATIVGGGGVTPTGLKTSSAAASTAGGGTPSPAASKTGTTAVVVVGGGEPVPGGAGQALSGTATVAGGGSTAPTGQKSAGSAAVIAAGGGAAALGSKQGFLGAVVGGDGAAAPVGLRRALTAGVVAGGGSPSPVGQGAGPVTNLRVVLVSRLPDGPLRTVESSSQVRSKMHGDVVVSRESP